jgi:hypothetical protein
MRALKLFALSAVLSLGSLTPIFDLAGAVSSATAHWDLNEASGSRTDTIAALVLTDNNTVGSASGQFGNAADFEASASEYLSVADTAAIEGGDIDFMVRCWVNLESKAAAGGIVAKWNGGDTEYLLYYDQSADRFTWFVDQAAGGPVFVRADNLGAVSTATWYLVHVWHDATNNLIGISVNAGTANTDSAPNGFIADPSNPPFHLGNFDGNYFDGLIDDVVILKSRFLDATERTADYNGGTGVSFADWDAPVGGALPAIINNPIRGGGELVARVRRLLYGGARVR